MRVRTLKPDFRPGSETEVPGCLRVPGSKSGRPDACGGAARTAPTTDAMRTPGNPPGGHRTHRTHHGRDAHAGQPARRAPHAPHPPRTRCARRQPTGRSAAQATPEPRRQRHPQPQRRRCRQRVRHRAGRTPARTASPARSPPPAQDFRVVLAQPVPVRVDLEAAHVRGSSFFARSASRYESSGSVRSSFVPCTISTLPAVPDELPSPCSRVAGAPTVPASGSQGASASTELTAGCPAACSAARPPMSRRPGTPVRRRSAVRPRPPPTARPPRDARPRRSSRGSGSARRAPPASRRARPGARPGPGAAPAAVPPPPRPAERRRRLRVHVRRRAAAARRALRCRTGRVRAHRSPQPGLRARATLAEP